MPAPIHGKRQDPNSPLKTCSRCRIDKPRTREFFSPYKRTSDGLTSACKKCHCELTIGRIRSSQEEFERTGYITTEASRASNRNNEKERFKKDPSKKIAKVKNQQRWRSSSVRAWMCIAVSGVRVRARKEKLEFSLSWPYLVDMYESQSGRCAITGNQLTMECGKGRIPSNVSIDRIDPKLGYTEGNVQLVTYLANTMKQNLTSEQLYEFCFKVLHRAGRLT